MWKPCTDVWCMSLFVSPVENPKNRETNHHANVFSRHCFTHFSKTTAPQEVHVIFEGKLSTIIIFKPCKFNVKLWTFWKGTQMSKYSSDSLAHLVWLYFLRPCLNTLHRVYIACLKSFHVTFCRRIRMDELSKVLMKMHSSNMVTRFSTWK